MTPPFVADPRLTGVTSIRITNIRLTELHGLFESEGDFWEERLVRPLDVYPEHKRDPDQHIPKAR